MTNSHTTLLKSQHHIDNQFTMELQSTRRRLQSNLQWDHLGTTLTKLFMTQSQRKLPQLLSTSNLLQEDPQQDHNIGLRLNPWLSINLNTNSRRTHIKIKDFTKLREDWPRPKENWKRLSKLHLKSKIWKENWSNWRRQLLTVNQLLFQVQRKWATWIISVKRERLRAKLNSQWVQARFHWFHCSAPQIANILIITISNMISPRTSRIQEPKDQE